MYPVFSLWYDLTPNWTLVSRTIGEQFNHYDNRPVYLYIYITDISILTNVRIGTVKFIVMRFILLYFTVPYRQTPVE